MGDFIRPIFNAAYDAGASTYVSGTTRDIPVSSKIRCAALPDAAMTRTVRCGRSAIWSSVLTQYESKYVHAVMSMTTGRPACTASVIAFRKCGPLNKSISPLTLIISSSSKEMRSKAAWGRTVGSRFLVGIEVNSRGRAILPAIEHVLHVEATLLGQGLAAIRSISVLISCSVIGPICAALIFPDGAMKMCSGSALTP